jgi:predicted nucleic acid-binding protein
MKSATKEVLLDSSVLIDVLRGRPKALERFDALISVPCNLSTTALNAAEVYAGLRDGEETATAALFLDMTVYDVTHEIGLRAGLLKNTAARTGRTFALHDMIVAATALEHGLTVWTDNEKDFAVPGIVLYKPSNA